MRSSNITLNNNIVKRFLDRFLDFFVIVLIDKANDTAIICKHFYMKVLKKHLGIENKLKTNSTYKYLPKTIEEALIHSHSRFILKNFQQKRKIENQFLP